MSFTQDIKLKVENTLTLSIIFLLVTCHSSAEAELRSLLQSNLRSTHGLAIHACFLINTSFYVSCHVQMKTIFPSPYASLFFVLFHDHIHIRLNTSTFSNIWCSCRIVVEFYGFHSPAPITFFVLVWNLLLIKLLGRLSKISILCNK